MTSSFDPRQKCFFARMTRAVIFILSLLPFASANAQTPPPGFASQTVSNQWNEAAGLTFNADGSKMFVWERGGRVWVVINNQKQLLLDISDEVGAWHDHGLLGFALHPLFEQNGYFYLLYLVDRHHLMFSGTGSYNPATNDYFSATIGRVTRYTATKVGAGYSVDPASRKILIGATRSTGIASIMTSHVTGSLVFGTDNTLLVSTGDGAGPFHDAGSGFTTYFQQALNDGIITPAENVGTFRSQLLDCHNGKILRIDPETGEGVPSNPFYDASRPSAPISKVYALGLRQPFKMSLKPGTGSHNPADGNPGILYVGDVGYDTWEEINVIDKPGMNLGWPIYEGFEASTIAPLNTQNLMAPNPLYQVNGCNRQFFYFQDLLKQTTASGQVSFPNPCNPGQSIPSSIKTFIHSRPIIDWQHDVTQSRTGIFNGETAGVINIGAPGSPVAGPQFRGSASVGGVFYTGTDFPPEYQNSYFFGDYSEAWLRNLTIDDTDKPVLVRNFINSGAVVVGMATNPNLEGLYYVNFPSEIRRVYYSNNRPPVANATSDVTFGAAPLNVQFTGSNSSDPENQALTYEWNFGDGSPVSTQPNPVHVFSAPSGTPTKYNVVLKVSDVLGVSTETTLSISVNNSPPQVAITSPVNNALYSISGETNYILTATVSDEEHSGGQLSYQWQTILHHDNHQHPDPIDTSPVSATTVAPLGCDGQTYFYRIKLTVTDAAGASTSDEVRVYPDCALVPKKNTLITWANPSPIIQGMPLTTTQLNATATHGGLAVPGTLVYSPAIGTLLEIGLGQPLSVTFTPTDTSQYSGATKMVSIDVTEFVKITPVITWANPAPITVGTALGTTQLNATASHNGVPVAGTFIYTPASGVVLGLGLAQTLSVNFTPTDVTLYNSAVKTASIDVLAATSSVFYRAINLNGASLVIDGVTWQGSAGAPNFSFTTNASSFVDQTVPLVPATDANRATMIRSSIFGNVSLNVGAVPPGTYQVWLYVWEDNIPQVFSVALEGIVVQSNYNSGSAGVWRKLGPFQANITDGTINVSTTGGHANLSGIEIWSMQAGGNQPPVVSTPIPDQTATEGVAYNFAFGAGTFSDPNPGTVLTYTTALSAGGALPSWLTFNTSTRTFSGTPGAGNVGALDIRVTASDGTASINDVFRLTVNTFTKVTPLISWPAPASITVGTALSATQLNATASYNGSPVTGTFSYTPPSGSMLSLGTGQSLSVSFAPTNTTLYNTATASVQINVVAAGSSTFYRAINLNGGALTIDGNPWQASTGAANFSFTTNFTVFANQAITLVPATDANRATMIRSSIYGNVNLNVGGVPPGTYQVWLYVWEDNNPQIFSVALEGTVVQSNYNSGSAGVWRKLGPFQTNITDGTINVSTTGGHANLSGIEIWGIQAGNQPPVVSIAIPDQLATESLAFNYVFGAGTFSDPNPGTVLSYSATLSAGGALPVWLNFNASTRTFSGMPSATDLGPIDIRVTASDGSGGSVNDVFTLTVNPLIKVTPIISWPAPASITAGTPLSAMQLNAAASYNGSPVAGTFTYTPPSGTWLAIGAGQTLSVNFIPTNGLLYNTASASVAVDVTAPVKITPIINWTNPAAITVGTALSTTQLNATATHNGTPVAGTFIYTPPEGTVPGLGAGQPLSVVFTPSNTANYNGANKMVSIDVNEFVKLTPVINWSNPSPISVGTALSATHLNATATDNGTPVAGTFSYTPPEGTLLGLGAGQPLSVVFTPTNTAIYNDANKTVSIDVIEKLTPVINWSNPSPITVGTALTTTQLNAAASHNGTPVAGTFTYTPLEGTVLGVGAGQPLSVVFTPTNTDVYNVANKMVFIDVNEFIKLTPVITWSNPSSIIVGTALSTTQLNATAMHNGMPVAGAFSYTPAEGTLLGLGAGQPLSVAFTPSNTATYNGANKAVSIDVIEKLIPIITWSTPSPITVGTALSSAQLNATAAHNGTPVSGTFTYTPPGGALLGVGAGQPLSVVFTPTNVATYSGATKMVSVDVTEFVKITPVITWANPAPITVGTALGTTQLNATASHNGVPVAGTFIYTPASGVVLGLGLAQTLSVNFTPTDVTLYNSAVKTASIDVLAATSSVFYRAINLNGASLVIDGVTWQGSAGAPNFSFTTNASSFVDQTVPLVPATDANRATMIRSSIFGNVNLNVGAVPPGTYQVWLYVWEDNIPQVFSVALEGIVVQSNYNSGSAGVWRKLGPFQANITDGTINVSTTGGHANLSGIEIWSMQAGGNQPPVVSTPIPDQTATEGVAYNFAFGAGTFSDPNPGTVLTYTTALSAGGALPSWLTFNTSTRTFSGTPGAGNVGALDIRVTASDGTASINDVFRLTVNTFTKVTPLISWPAPASITVGTALSATQLNATASYNGSPVTGTFTYTPPSGSMLSLGTGQSLSVSFAPTNTTLYNTATASVQINVVAAGSSTFYRAINLNGGALTIDGNPWQASTGAANFSFTTNFTVFANQAITLVPATDANRATMIRSSIYGNVNLNVGGVPPGTYQVWLYVWEDNNPQIFSVALEGTVVQSNYNSGSAGVWRKLGPFQTSITDGTINVSTTGGHANLSGIEIWRNSQAGGGRLAAEVSTPMLLDSNEEEGILLSAYPNPFPGKVNISFGGKPAVVSQLAMYDIRGMMIRVLFEGIFQEGKQEELELEVDLPDGVYVLQLINGRDVRHHRLILTR